MHTAAKARVDSTLMRDMMAGVRGKVRKQKEGSKTKGMTRVLVKIVGKDDGEKDCGEKFRQKRLADGRRLSPFRRGGEKLLSCACLGANLCRVGEVVEHLAWLKHIVPCVPSNVDQGGGRVSIMPSSRNFLPERVWKASKALRHVDQSLLCKDGTTLGGLLRRTRQR
jgi:hypothetical protein